MQPEAFEKKIKKYLPIKYRQDQEVQTAIRIYEKVYKKEELSDEEKQMCLDRNCFDSLVGEALSPNVALLKAYGTLSKAFQSKIMESGLCVNLQVTASPGPSSSHAAPATGVTDDPKTRKTRPKARKAKKARWTKPKARKTKKDEKDEYPPRLNLGLDDVATTSGQLDGATTSASAQLDDEASSTQLDDEASSALGVSDDSKTRPKARKAKKARWTKPKVRKTRKDEYPHRLSRGLGAVAPGQIDDGIAAAHGGVLAPDLPDDGLNPANLQLQGGEWMDTVEKVAGHCVMIASSTGQALKGTLWLLNYAMKKAVSQMISSLAYVVTLHYSVLCSLTGFAFKMVLLLFDYAVRKPAAQIAYVIVYILVFLFTLVVSLAEWLTG